MYSGYRRQDIFKEYAVTFFALLNEGYRIRYSAAGLAAQIADLPSMEKVDRAKFYQELEWASTHPGDILKSEADAGSSPEEIKRLLRG